MGKERKAFALFRPKHAVLLAVAILGICYSLMLGSAQAPEEEKEEQEAQYPAQETVEKGDTLRMDSELTQTMGFTLCGHSVTRRIHPAEGLIGADFSETQAYYDLWQIESFGSEKVMMKREIALYCPMHYVLTANEAGEIVLTQNQYGDGMAVLKGYEKQIDQWPEEEQRALLLGMPFDSPEEAERWMAEH